jgi:hypothetical protein
LWPCNQCGGHFPPERMEYQGLCKSCARNAAQAPAPPPMPGHTSSKRGERGSKGRDRYREQPQKSSHMIMYISFTVMIAGLGFIGYLIATRYVGKKEPALKGAEVSESKAQAESKIKEDIEALKKMETEADALVFHGEWKLAGEKYQQGLDFAHKTQISAPGVDDIVSRLEEGKRRSDQEIRRVDEQTKMAEEDLAKEREAYKAYKEHAQQLSDALLKLKCSLDTGTNTQKYLEMFSDVKFQHERLKTSLVQGQEKYPSYVALCRAVQDYDGGDGARKAVQTAIEGGGDYDFVELWDHLKAFFWIMAALAQDAGSQALAADDRLAQVACPYCFGSGKHPVMDASLFPEKYRKSTPNSSTEPCPMCGGTKVWPNDKNAVARRGK